LVFRYHVALESNLRELSNFKSNEKIIYLKNKEGHITKTVHYYTLEITQLSQIGLESDVVPKNQLQLEEVDWAGFVSIEDARKRMWSKLLGILPQPKAGKGEVEKRVAGLRILERRAKGDKKQLLSEQINNLIAGIKTGD